MYLVEQKHIEAESYNLHKDCPTRSSEDNWAIAQDNLTIFPSRQFSFVASSSYGPADGFFCVPLYNHWLRTRSNSMTESPARALWIGCRETFERAVYYGRLGSNYQYGHETILADWHYFYYRCHGQYPEQEAIQMAKFIRYLEVVKLDLHELTKFEKCGYDVKVTPSSFWHHCSMRFSLFTLLCRSGVYFNCNLEAPNLDHCFLSGMKGRSKNMAAIYHFLSGHHRFNGTHNVATASRNWIDTFVEGNVSLLSK